MAKYIVDIPDEYEKSYAQTNSGTLRIPMQVGTRNYNVWVGTGLRVTPYTEPDEDEIRNKAEDEVWKSAKKICGLAKRDFDECFGHTTIHGVLTTYDTYREAKREYEKWKKSKEIRVGDEVEYSPNKAKGIVVQCHVPDVYAEVDKYAIFTGASVEYLPIEWLTKTGRVFPEVAELLKKMREEDD